MIDHRHKKQASTVLFMTLSFMFVAACTRMGSESQKPLGTSSLSAGEPDGIREEHVVKIADSPTKDETCTNGIQFISPDIGWISSDKELWQTVDGGMNWTMINLDNAGGVDHFYFIGPRDGWSFSSGKLKKTDDGGHTWVRVRLSSRIVISSMIFLPDGKKGWLGGARSHVLTLSMLDDASVRTQGITNYYGIVGKAPRSVILYTEDGGKNWREQSIPLVLGVGVNRIYASQSGEIWASAGSILYRQEEDNWEETDFLKSTCSNQILMRTAGLTRSPYDPSEIVDIVFAGSMNGWILFENGYIARSVDGGQTWCDVFYNEESGNASEERLRFEKIHFVDSQTGWALSEAGKLYRTRDSGSTWAVVAGDVKFSDMRFLDSSHAWALSPTGIFKINP